MIGYMPNGAYGLMPEDLVDQVGLAKNPHDGRYQDATNNYGFLVDRKFPETVLQASIGRPILNVIDHRIYPLDAW